MAKRTFHQEEGLRARVTAEAKLAYRERWGEAFHATHAQTLDSGRWRTAWESARKREQQAQRHFAAMRTALTNAALFVEACNVADPELPLGGTAQILCDCGPTLVRTLDRVDRRREYAITVQRAEPVSRSRWIRFRLRPLWYRDESALRAAPRDELATLALLGGWWPPKAALRVALLRGVTVGNVFAWEGDLIDRARKRVLVGIDAIR